MNWDMRRLLDHLVGAGDNGRRDGHAERHRGPCLAQSISRHEPTLDADGAQ